MPDVALRGLGPGLHQALKAAAERNHRSLNGEILARLEASFEVKTMNIDTVLERIRARKGHLIGLNLDEAVLRELKGTGRP